MSGSASSRRSVTEAERPLTSARVRPSRADAPREDHLLRILRQALAQLAAQCVRQLEHALDVRLLGAGPDDAGARPAAEQQIERVGQHGLARTGLPRQDVEPWREAQLGLLDQQEVLDPELVEHARWSTSAPRRIGPVCNRLVTSSAGATGQPPELLPQPAVEGRPGLLREHRRVGHEPGPQLGPRLERARRAAVDREVHAVLRPAQDPQPVVGRDDQRAGRERVRRDERHPEALHAPRHDRAAVGEVVARRAGGRADHDPVAAHRADLLAVEEVRQLRDAVAHAPVQRDVVEGEVRALVDPHVDRREVEPLELPAERPREALGHLVGVDGGEEADLAEVHREDGHARAGVGPQRAQDRAVAAERDAEVDVGQARSRR